jgi:hypothetical protein
MLIPSRSEFYEIVRYLFVFLTDNNSRKSSSVPCSTQIPRDGAILTVK